jgi:mannose-6-phosphate isomerase-like protein (cupin superfamily)
LQRTALRAAAATGALAGNVEGIVLRVIDISSGERYQWGAGSEGWHLLNRSELSVIQECVPPRDGERRHFHSRARQFFYILQGQAVLEVDGSRFEIRAGQGLEVPPGAWHQFMNESTESVTFLVVSSPHSHGDRTNAEAP